MVQPASESVINLTVALSRTVKYIYQYYNIKESLSLSLSLLLFGVYCGKLYFTKAITITD